MIARELPASRKLERLAAPLLDTFVHTEIGDTVRLAQSDGAWFYCRVEDCMPDGDLLCSVIETPDWPALMMDGIIPGVRYVVPPDRVLSVVRPHD